MRKKFNRSLILIFLGISLGYAQQPYKQRLLNGWEFIKGDLGGVWEAVRSAGEVSTDDVLKWEKIKLPHCFNAFDAVDPDVPYYQGAGWYRTLLPVDNPYHLGRTLLHFEGAGQKTEVYVYTTKVGSHVGGYDEWTVDITDALAEFTASESLQARFGGRVPLIIRCDNSRDLQMIPSSLSDFTIYGGLYRYLNLTYVPQLSIDRLEITP
jgi:beta-galactosidase